MTKKQRLIRCFGNGIAGTTLFLCSLASSVHAEVVSKVDSKAIIGADKEGNAHYFESEQNLSVFSAQQN